MPDWSFRPATHDDLAAVSDLKVLVIREHLDRVISWDEQATRQYLVDRWVPGNSRIIEVGGVFAGCVAVRQAEDCRWIEQFYLVPEFQGQGLGSGVLTALLAEADADGAVLRLDVLQHSPARRLYERHGFVFEREDETDVYLIRYPK